MNKRAVGSRRKLILNKSTLKHLTSNDLRNVAGGKPGESRVTNCPYEEPCGPTAACSQDCTSFCSNFCP